MSRWKLNNFKKIKTISHYKISIKTRLRPDFRHYAVRKQKEGSTTNKNGPPDVEQKVRKEQKKPFFMRPDRPKRRHFLIEPETLEELTFGLGTELHKIFLGCRVAKETDADTW